MISFNDTDMRHSASVSRGVRHWACLLLLHVKDYRMQGAKP